MTQEVIWIAFNSTQIKHWFYLKIEQNKTMLTIIHINKENIYFRMQCNRTTCTIHVTTSNRFIHEL